MINIVAAAVVDSGCSKIYTYHKHISKAAVKHPLATHGDFT